MTNLTHIYLNYLNGQNGKVLNPETPYIEYNFESKIKLTVSPYRFEPGKAYTINIYVYGLQHINIEALFGRPWIQVDQPIEIDEDSVENKDRYY